MLDNKKIRMMTKLSIYEDKIGKKDILLGRYYKTDYVRYKMLKSAVATTVGYILILAMIIIYKLEYLIQNAVTLDYINIGTKILGIYIILLIIYVIGSLIAYSIEYDISRRRLGRYYKSLTKLEEHIDAHNQEI